MTDSRLPERYLTDRRILRLTDTERNSYIMGTLWSVSNRTDGRIERDDLQFIPTFNLASIPALTRTGLWSEETEGWVDTEFDKVQTSKDDLEVLDNARRADRQKKARQRAHKKGDHALCEPGECRETTGNTPSFPPSPGDSPGDESRGQHRRGEDRLRDVVRSTSSEEKPKEQIEERAAWFAANPDWIKEETKTVNPQTGEVTSPTLAWDTVMPGEPLKALDKPLKKSSFPECRLCGQQATHLDSAGLCRKVTPDHMHARAAA